jgi:NAD(P)-dependent dehydrogenase (short-subunit alcohol dehydrogenase family)
MTEGKIMAAAKRGGSSKGRAGGALAGQRVVITAGASGIGRAIADLLLANGVKVAICDVGKEFLAAYRKAHPGSPAVAADVSSEKDVDKLFKTVAKELGGLDALINNAGIAGPTGGVDEIDPADWRRCIDIDLTGPFLCARRAVPMIRKAGGGSIVNMSSAAGRFGYAFRTPYSAAKWGIIGFTQSLAKELGPDNIRVNAILPGIVKGPRMDRVIEARAKQVGVSHEEMEKRYLERVSLRRMVTPEDIAESVMFLLSRAGANISGQSLGVDANVESL